MFVMLLLISSALSISAASTPYKTYTYTMDGLAAYSPAAYVPDREIDYYTMNMDTPLSNEASDLFVAPDGKLYIADKGNSRVVVLDSNAQYITEIKEFVNEQGVPDKLSECEGVFVNDKNIYICDTKNARIVVFDLDFNFDHIINAPEADVMGSSEKFRPIAMAVDSSGRMYIVSNQTFSGIFAINADGSFQGFVGVQKASVPLSVRIRRVLFPNTVTETYNSVAYKNISIDDDDFIWVTTFGDTKESSDDTTLETKLLGGDADYATVKRLNAAGQDIMIRNGFFMPIGEVNFVSNKDTKSSAPVKGPSKLVDVTLGPNGTWSTIDRDRSRIYTYDNRGQLLYAFGDAGNQLGNLKTPTSIAYVGSDIYVLGQSIIQGRGSVITVFKRTEYGDLIDAAIKYNNNRDYDNALTKWKEILQRNNNFDSAYVGIGENLFLQNQYKEAMTYFKAATDTTDYSECFRMLRKQWVEKYFLVVLVVLAVVIFLLVKAFSAIKKKNAAGTTKGGKRTFWEEVLFAFHLILHPFDGFWDLKHEKRGSLRGAIFHVALACVTVIYNSVGMAYIFNPTAMYSGNTFNMLYTVATVVVPLALWCVANWCVTTLFDGEGTLKDIFIATSYSLLPLTLTLIPTTILSNVAVEGEGSMLKLVYTIGFIWVGLLIFFGTMTTHGYSMGKNILATFGTILGMLFIMFIVMLFFNLIQKMVGFISGIIEEIAMQR